MENEKIKVKMTAHAFNAFMNRAGISGIDNAMDNLNSLSYGNLDESRGGTYLNFPFIGGQMPLAREDNYYVAKTFVKTFGTDKGKEVKVEYVF